MGADEYERQFMDGNAAVYAERHVARIFTAFMALVALIAFGAGIAVLFSKSPAAAAIGPFFASAMVMFAALFWAVMRITVTRDRLNVDYGMLGARIPLSAITKCTLDAQIGTGAKWAPGGWRYAPLGTTRGISVEWKDGAATKRCYIGSRDPEALLRSVEAGRGARARIAGDPASVDAAAREAAEAEAEADAEAATGTTNDAGRG